MPNPLAALFLPKRRLAAADPLILQRGAVLGGTQWVVPRGECQYRRHDFSALTARQRQAAAALHVKRYLPTSESLARIGWLDGIAHFWIWEKPLPAVIRSRQKWLPESALRRPMLPNGLHLLKCERGLEGQAWRDGNLMASQWWPMAPDIDDWHRFLRSAGLPVDQAPAVPSVQNAPLLAYPWPQMQPVRSGQLANAEFLIWVTSFCLLAAAAGWQASSLQEWRKLRAAQEVELATLRAQAGPILEARERAEAAVARLQEMQSMLQGVSDYDLIADMVRPLPAGTRLLNYTRETGKLQATVTVPGQGTPGQTMPGTSGQAAAPVTLSLGQLGLPGAALPRVDVRRIVALYQGHPLLSDASATPVPGGLLLEFALPKSEEEDKAAVDASRGGGR